MATFSLQWNGTTVGDATLAKYDQDAVSVWYQAGSIYDRATQGVLQRDDTVVVDGNSCDLSGRMEVTNPTGFTLRVGTGGAIVDGVPCFRSTYGQHTTTDDGTAITNPGSGSNFYRVVLRKDWTAQTVRPAVLDVNTSAPLAVTQTQGVVWEISLATVEITSGSAVTITDTRVWCGPKIATDNIADEAVTAAKIDNRTRTFLVQCNGRNATDSINAEFGAYGPVLNNNKDASVFGQFYCPADFVSGLTVIPIVESNATGNIYVGAQSDYGALGENFPHTEGTIVTLAATAVTSAILTALSTLELTLSSLVAGDYVSLSFRRDATDVADTGNTVDFFGFLVSYTADS